MANSFRQIVEAPSQFFQELSNLVPWLSKLWRTLGQVEEWHEIGSGGGEPGFGGTWVNFGISDASAAFYKDPWGVVHIKGLIKSGTITTAAFTLPVGYRPPLDSYFASYSNGAFGGFSISSSGVLIPQVGSNVSFSIECSFRVDD